MSTCIKSNPKPSPFSKWGIDDTVEYVSLYTQRKAQYAESAKETFNDGARHTFFGNDEAATPQIERIVGACNDKPIIYGYECADPNSGSEETETETEETETEETETNE